MTEEIRYCISCKQQITKDNTFTKDGWKETHLSGLCEVCFDWSTFSFYENLPVVLSHLPIIKDIVSMDGVILAGGALRQLVNTSDELCDYDLFFTSQGAVGAVKQILLDNGAQRIFECPQGLLFTYKLNEVKIQLIVKRLYRDIEDLVSSFDITSCCAAYDGVDIHMHKRFVSDNINKRIYLNSVEFPVATMKRITKYIEKGWWLPASTAKQFVEIISEKEWSEDDMQLYID